MELRPFYKLVVAFKTDEAADASQVFADCQRLMLLF